MKNKQTKIILMRHGESAGNALGIYQGRKFDTGLSDLGKKQAAIAAEFLKKFSFHSIFTSTLPRARETALLVKNFHPNASYDEFQELEERFVGDAEGILKSEFGYKYPHILAAWHNGVDARPEGGENFEDVERRVMPVVEKHVKENNGLTMLYIVHGDVIRVILGHALKIPFGFQARIKQSHCALNSLIFDHAKNCWEVEYVNFVSYVL